MSREFIIVESNGSRSVAENDLPLSIGSAANADIRIPGAVAEQSLALVSSLDGQPFLQPVGDARGISVNNEALVTTRWLSDGDVITVEGTQIDCRISPETAEFTVAYADIEYETLPPVIDEVAGQDSDDQETITPVRMRSPASAEKPAVSSRHRTLWLIGYGALILLLGMALYLFTAKAVLIEVAPADAGITIAGGLLKPQFGGRYLLRPGPYRVILKAEGYESMREEIKVDDADSQEFSFAMKKLPGLVLISNRQGIDAQVFIDGDEVGVTPTDEIPLEAGTHEVVLKAERYLDFEITLDVEGRGKSQLVEADLAPAWADITVTSAPPGAIVFADEQQQGETPTTVQLLAGAHQLMIQKEGFKIWRQAVTAVANEPQELPEIQLQQADSLLTVTSLPAGAAVSISARYRGTTPVQVELAPGKSYQLVVSKAGFATVNRNVTMESRRGKTVQIELEARIGVVRITSVPPDAELFVEGESRGAASQELSLPARPHRIEVRKTGFEPYFTEVTPNPGQPKVLEVRLLTPEQAILAATPKTITTGQGQVLQFISPGSFEMGASRREQGRRPNETLRKVELTRSFYLGIHEVTNGQFREFKPKHTSGAEKYRELSIDNHPVVMLSWEEAVGYCNWLSDQDSLPLAYVVENGEIVLASPVTTGYRLPTEAEWAWAARYNGGGGKLKYSWGDRLPPAGEAGNYADLAAQGFLANVISSYNDGFPVTAPVGKFSPSPIGLFDIGGNAAEWVNDHYSISASPSGVEVDPVGAAEGQYHVIRGSGWRHASISELRLSYRDFGDLGRLDIGFRIARYADEPKN